MKIFGKIIVGLAFCLVLSIASSSHAAEWGWHTCWVEQVGGQYSDNYYIVLTMVDDSHPDTFDNLRYYFYINPNTQVEINQETKNTIMAAAMTACATDKQVECYLKPGNQFSLHTLALRRVAASTP